MMMNVLVCCQGKMGKPDETWIMNRLIKQLTDMGFPVKFRFCFPLPFPTQPKLCNL